MSLSEDPKLISALPLDPYMLITEDPPAAESENVQEEKTKDWDVFDLKSDEWAIEDRSDVFKTLVKLLKVAVYVITFCIVLGCAVLSKGTVLLMTSAIRKKPPFTACGDDYRTDSLVVSISEEERRAWIWCLLFTLFVPEVLTFVRSARVCIFKHFNRPRMTTFFLVLVAESCHAVGVVLLLLIVFPRINVLKALTLTNAVCFVPSLVNFLSSWNSDCNKKAAKKTAFDLVAFVGQSTAIFAFAFYGVHKFGDVETWGCVVSLLLISCAWWENFVSDDSTFFRRLVNIKKDIEESRHFMYIFIPLIKIILILGSCVVCLFFMEYDIKNFFADFKNSFKSYNAYITSPLNITETVTIGRMNSNIYLPVIVACIHVASSYLCYSCSKFVCKICIQGFSFALPISLAVPTTMSLLYFACSAKLTSSCAFKGILDYIFWICPEGQLQSMFTAEAGFLWILWIVSQTWLTLHVWTPKTKRMASTNELFVNPLYCTVLIDQSLALNRKKDQKIDDLVEEMPEDATSFGRERSVPRILACATMWHETPDEMEQLLKSIMRMDSDQCLRRAIRNTFKGVINDDYYEMEAHIFFDDAFVISDEDDTKMVINNFVKDLIVAVETATRKVYPPDKIKMEPPIKVPTPYGGRLIWKLQGDNVLVAHLKNKDLIRHKKRWSQVMYMYYLLGYRLMCPDIPSFQREELARNTYILALDGDIDFKPDAVQLLVDLMKRNENLGAACGRIHPVGTGMMVYYQKFEYAIGHWLQKATEHMIGCVLCSPGCFSLFRAEALMADNVTRRYATKSREAIEYVQFDQGEDRWLCTLLLQSGSRVEYSAASDAYTHCPESFAEFYTQRRRWAPSTMANIMDLLLNYKETVQCNDNISLLYVAYQLMLMVGTVLGPGTIFLMLVGAMVSAFEISNWQSFIANLVPIAFFILICFLSKNDTQILIAQIFSAAYALLMMAVLVGISLQLVTDGIASPSAIFLLSMTASFVIAAILHPQEFWCVAHGLVYFLSVPSMYLLLTLYSIINLHVVSWGTREVATKKTKKQLEQEQKQAAEAEKRIQKSGIFDWFSLLGDNKRPGSEEEEGSISFGLANLFRCMCCTYPKPDTAKLHLVKIGQQLEGLNQQIKNLQMQIESSVVRTSGFRRRSLHGLSRDSHLIPVEEGEEEEQESETDEVDGAEDEEHVYNQIPSSSQAHPDEFWLTEPMLKKSPVWRLNEKEETFWKELIKTYLYPLIDDPEEKIKVATQLKELRNKVVFGILMLNSLFILIVFLLQMQKETLHIEWPFNGNATITYVPHPKQVVIEFEYLQLEPINLILVFFFSIIVVVQFIAMLFHRFQTMSHILASTDLEVCSKNSANPKESIMEELATVFLRMDLRPDISSVDAGVNARRRSTVYRLDHNRQERPSRQVRSLSIAYEHTLQKLKENDSQTVECVRRHSRNKAMLDVLRRYSPSPSRASTPGSSMRSSQGFNRLSSFSQDMKILDNAFSNSPRSSIRNTWYSNKGYEDSVDGRESVSSLGSRNQSLHIQDPRRVVLQSDVRRTSENIGRLKNIKERKEP